MDGDGWMEMDGWRWMDGWKGGRQFPACLSVCMYVRGPAGSTFVRSFVRSFVGQEEAVNRPQRTACLNDDNEDASTYDPGAYRHSWLVCWVHGE